MPVDLEKARDVDARTTGLFQSGTTRPSPRALSRVTGRVPQARCRSSGRLDPALTSDDEARAAPAQCTAGAGRQKRVTGIMDARDATLALLAARATTATICPSEVARALAATAGEASAEASWRDMMPTVHAAVDRLVAERVVRLSWKGKTLPVRSGPYRIASSADLGESDQG